MKINDEIFDKVTEVNAKVLVVTKYFDAEKTQNIFDQVKSRNSFLALGENRIDDIEKKNLPRGKVHFIGKIQSRNIPKIFQFCSAIHSLESVKHAQMFDNLARTAGEKFGVFLQINISGEEQKAGVGLKQFSCFLSEVLNLENLEILGISAIGAGKFTLIEKQAEFALLKKIRDKSFPNKKISAGTSRDFEIALSQGIEVVRIGKKLFNF